MKEFVLTPETAKTPIGDLIRKLYWEGMRLVAPDGTEVAELKPLSISFGGQPWEPLQPPRPVDREEMERFGRDRYGNVTHEKLMERLRSMETDGGEDDSGKR